MRHVQTRFLWIQERIALKHLTIHKIPGTENTSDILTKAVPSTLMQKHLATMKLEFREGFASKQKKALNAVDHPHSTTSNQEVNELNEEG